MSLSRRELLRLAAAAGALPALGGALPRARADDEADGAAIIGPDYLRRGLASLAVAHQFHWNVGHHGCAVIAGYYLCRESRFDEPTARALKAHLDAFIAHRARYFPDALPDGADEPADTAPLLETLAPQVASLRSGGHDAIYTALALRALADVPRAATPEIVDGVRKLLERFYRDVAAVEPHEHHRAHPLPPYRDADDLVAVTADAVLRPWSHFVMGTPTGHGNVVHWITHADALLTLRDLGHGELAEKGERAHQQYLNHPVAPDAPPLAEPEPPALHDWRSAAYWQSQLPRDVQKRSWFFGHSFKLPYSLFRLLERVPDEDRRARLLARAALLPEGFR